MRPEPSVITITSDAHSTTSASTCLDTASGLILARTGSASGEREDGGVPGRHVQEETARRQIVAVAIVGRLADPVLEPPASAPEVREGQPHVALALVGRVVHGDEQPFAGRVLPGKGHEAVTRPVAVPRRATLEQSPLALAHGRSTEDGEEPLVEASALLVQGLVRTP